MPDPPVSVVIPVYNSARTLNAALKSVFAQTMPDFEVVAVDDGSTDGSGEILGFFAMRDSRLKVISLGHGGIVKALNAGIDASGGEYIARMDADDVCHPTRLARQLSHMRSRPGCALLGSRVRLFPRHAVLGGMLHYEGWLNSVVTPAEIWRDLFIESPFAHPAVIFKRSAYDAVGGYREIGMPEDYDLWLRFAAAGYGMEKLPEELLYWRSGASSLSKVDGMYSAENFRRLKAMHLRDWRLKGVDKIQLWGAGRDGKTWAKLLRETGFDVLQFIDIDKKKVGGRACWGVPVVWPADIIRGVPILCAVGIKGARAQIRDYLLMDGFSEPDEFMFLA